MLLASDVHTVDRRRGRVRLEDGRTLRIVASGDHHGRPCPTILASHAIALDDRGRAYAIDVLRMVTHPLGAVASSIMGGVV